jgi:hypothetical protein
MPIRQAPSVVLPIPTLSSTGTETELINDLVTHVSFDIPVENLREKKINLIATEIIAAGVVGPLWCWIETSPVPSTISTAYWAAIGGGGGALPPLAPVIEIPTGVTLTVHSFELNWNIHSLYARLIVQTPVAATPLTAFWSIQALFSGQY